MGVLPAASLNAKTVTNAPYVTAPIAVSTALPLPPTVVRALTSALPPRPLGFRSPSLHVLLRLFLPLCLVLTPVFSLSLLC